MTEFDKDGRDEILRAMLAHLADPPPVQEVAVINVPGRYMLSLSEEPPMNLATLEWIIEVGLKVMRLQQARIAYADKPWLPVFEDARTKAAVSMTFFDVACRLEC
jgi:hypothetical protein